MRSAALEYAQQGIRINAISPGGMETEMMQRAAGTPEEASREREFFKSRHRNRLIMTQELCKFL